MMKLRRDRTSVAGMASYPLTTFWPFVYFLMTRRPGVIHGYFAVPVGILALLAKRISGTP